MPSHTSGLRRPATVAALAAAALAAGLLASPSSAAAADVRIHDIQGSTRVSPLAGKQVTGVSGTVTAVRAFGSARGFWMQDTAPDADPATSEGIFVFTGSTTPAVAVGDDVVVAGTVSEFYPGGASAGGQSLTELSKATWTVRSGGNTLPEAFTLDPRSVPDRYIPQAGGGSIEPLPLRPRSYAMDLYESLEGMRVQVCDSRVVGPTTSFHEVWVTSKPRENRTERGGTLYSSYDDQNTGRLKVVSLIPFAERPFPEANVGDVLEGTTAGPLDYDQFGGYVLEATALGERRDNGLEPERTRAQKRGELSVGTYNVENLSPKDSQEKFDRLAKAVVGNLASPDIVTLEEIQDDNGPTNDSVVSAEETLKKFTDAVKAAGGPAYEWRQINPVDDQDGGQPGGNIRVAFLFNPERVSFTDRPGGDSTTAVQVVDNDGEAALSASPGRIDPANSAWNSSRKPLVGEFSFRGRTVFVIANHFNSKGGDQSLDSRFQPPVRSSETQRVQQAIAVNAFVGKLLDIDPRANVVAAGDFNDYSFSPALRTLTGDDTLVDLVDELPRRERYSYVFNGNSQTLDHILTSPGIRNYDYDVVHINAEFADQASDHDPQVVRIHPRS
ncbi:endonuclease/exonuclease/phosphatase family protein [Wenjunlia tyrosinilytica]|uniref:Endonuclease n=1 Tax=Wenjunlia tyrosinilytica TaxID=1544741 RepID=A0A917ZEI9_9ACTN|nr:endonuclease/exonuclease/phosphatase family protein [Wenjunlia tyrosinilytica]GGO81361.1 endonuclease [Wenjunlia tyrosinilytica]